MKVKEQVKELHDLSDAELNRELGESQRELQNLRFRLGTRQLSNTSEVYKVKHKIARIKTVLRERQLGIHSHG